jgi:hypothetical protein
MPKNQLISGTAKLYHNPAVRCSEGVIATGSDTLARGRGKGDKSQYPREPILYPGRCHSPSVLRAAPTTCRYYIGTYPLFPPHEIGARGAGRVRLARRAGKAGDEEGTGSG